MKKFLKNNKVQIILAIILAIIIGIIFNGKENLANNFLEPLGEIFLNLIKCFMIPVIFFSIIMGILNLESIEKLKKIGIKILILFTITTICASIIGLIIANLFDLSITNFQINKEFQLEKNIGEMNIITALFSFIPENIFGAFFNSNIIQIVFISIIIGCIILKNKKSMENLIKLCNELNELFKKIISIVLKMIPIGVFVLLTPVIIRNDFESIISLGKIILVYLLACVVHIVLVYIPIVVYSKKVKLGNFFKTIFPTMVLAFSSASSLATLGSSMESCKKLGIKDEISEVTLPIGATINMDGTAIFLSIVSMFIARIYGIELNFIQMLLLVLVTVATSIGTPGIPGASLLIIAITLQSVGLPLNGIGLIAGIDILLEMFGTAMNVCGDIVCSLYIDKNLKGGLNESNNSN